MLYKVIYVILFLNFSFSIIKAGLFDNFVSNGDYCFPSQFGLNGPINNLLVIAPMSPDQMDVKFLLFTCKNRDQSQNFTYLSDPTEWAKSNFNKSTMTKFIIHGFLEGYPVMGEFNWIESMKNQFLDKLCVNVVVVDWHKGASSMYYYQSASNTRIVGQMISCIVNRWTTSFNYNPDNIHIIEFSLGAQTAGFAGKKITPKVRQITGIDPAGPGFVGSDDLNKLAVTDAKSVIVLHTNGARTGLIIDGLGYLDPMGNYDFYPNGGTFQPGCSADAIAGNVANFILDPNTNFAIKDVVACNHLRAPKYIVTDQTLVNSPKCQMIGYNCSSYAKFKLGLCADCDSDGSGCQPMPFNLDYWENLNNFNTNSYHLQYYLDTGNVYSSQYCLFHYQLIMHMNGVGNCFGSMDIKLSNGQTISIYHDQNNLMGSATGGYHKFAHLITREQELGQIIQMKVQPSVQINCMATKIDLRYMSHIDPSVCNSMSSVLCSSDGLFFDTNC